MVSRPNSGTSAAFSLCYNGNVPDVSDLFVGQAGSSIGYFANRANAQVQLWTNNTSRVVVLAPGGVTVSAPDSFATTNTLLLNGGFGNNGLPVFQISNGQTNQAVASWTSAATSGAQAVFTLTTGNGNGININGDGSFQIGSSASGAANLTGSGGSFTFANGATHTLDIANNGGVTVSSASFATAPANQMNCGGYQVNGWPAFSSTISASAAINTTDTYISAAYAANGGAAAAANQCFKITAYGTCTSTVANVSTFRPRMGTAGTTADTLLTTLTCTAAASGTTIPFIYETWITIRTVGTSGTVWAFSRLTNSGATGISSTQVVVSTGGSTTVNTSGFQHIGLSYSSAASTTTSTFQSVIVERLF